MLQQDEVIGRLRDSDGGDVLNGQLVGDLDLQGQVLDVCLNLTGARLTGRVDLSRAKLLRGFRASFAIFDGPLCAPDCEVFGDLLLSNTCFAKEVDLSWARVRGRVWAWRARFHGDATFFQLVCSPAEERDGSFVYPGELNFSWSWFYGKVLFERVRFEGPAYFWRTRFFDNCSFNESSFARDATFMGKVSEICLWRNEIGPDFFTRLESVGLLRPGTEEYALVGGRKIPVTGHLIDINSLQELQIRMREAGLTPEEKDSLDAYYRRHAGPMFGKEMSLQRMRFEQPKQIRFIGVNACEWSLAGTDMDAISYFNSDEQPVPRAVGLGHIYRTVFISYGGPDEPAARQFRDALLRAGVTTYFYREDAVPGRIIDEEMQTQIRNHDHVLLICSLSAPERPGWRFELEQTLQREEIEGQGKVLLPVSIDNCVDAGSPWKADSLLSTLCRRDVTPFQNTLDDPEQFNKSLGRILKRLDPREG